MSSTTAETDSVTSPTEVPTLIELTLQVSDRELCTDLHAHGEGRARHDFAVDAMRIGALALRRAQGQIDADRVRNEGERILVKLEESLVRHQGLLEGQLTGTLKEYFDPADGRFSERINRLFHSDGDLEQLLRRAVGPDGSELTSTLCSHVGEHSPLLRLLDPQAAGGIIAAMEGSLDEALKSQRDRLLVEFSLDNPDGALSRLVQELKRSNGKIVGEFSLDDDDSALSRLVRQIQTQQRAITAELSLDQDGSALSRVRRELLEFLKGQQEQNERFQREVGETLAALQARREESRSSTRHGDDFEVAVFEFTQAHSQQRGDIATHTGRTTGTIRNCKKGDAVVQLGPDHVAAGGRIVVEAKENSSYTLPAALEEIEEARKNRGAQVGLFVFSKATVPSDLESLARYGSDITVVWDSEDPATDVNLTAGLELARALVARETLEKEGRAADLEAIDTSIRAIEKELSSLDEIDRWAGTVESNGRKIIDKVRRTRQALVKEVEALDARLVELRSVLGGEPA